MRGLILAGVAAWLLAGCAAPPPPQPVYLPESAYVQSGERTRTSADLDMTQRQMKLLQDRLGVTWSPTEGATIRAEIERLKARVDELELALAGMPAVERSNATTQPASSYGASPVYTGPRGGRYTISPSGNKQYIRRR